MPPQQVYYKTFFAGESFQLFFWPRHWIVHDLGAEVLWSRKVSARSFCCVMRRYGRNGRNRHVAKNGSMHRQNAVSLTMVLLPPSTSLLPKCEANDDDVDKEEMKLDWKDMFGTCLVSFSFMLIGCLMHLRGHIREFLTTIFMVLIHYCASV